MSEIVNFIKENIKEIVIIIVVVLFLLVLINIKGLDLNEPKPETKLVQQVTVETFNSGLGENMEDIVQGQTESFCESYLGNSAELEKACNKLTKSKCANVKCCVYGNEKCVAGDMGGPTYKTDEEGKLVTMDSYYYLGKCRGRCPT